MKFFERIQEGNSAKCELSLQVDFEDHQIMKSEREIEVEGMTEAISMEKNQSVALKSNQVKPLKTKDKYYQCEICNKESKTLSNLKRHKRIHTGEKPFKCDTCDKSFGLKATLIGHRETHNNIKSFECKTCGKCFKQLRYLKHSVQNRRVNPI